jgi:hypothetical protein
MGEHPDDRCPLVIWSVQVVLAVTGITVVKVERSGSVTDVVAVVVDDVDAVPVDAVNVQIFTDSQYK